MTDHTQQRILERASGWPEVSMAEVKKAEKHPQAQRGHCACIIAFRGRQAFVVIVRYGQAVTAYPVDRTRANSKHLRVPCVVNLVKETAVLH